MNPNEKEETEYYEIEEVSFTDTELNTDGDCEECDLLEDDHEN